MTRTLILTVATIGISPAVLLAFGNLVGDLAAVAYRPVSLSFRVYRSDGALWIFDECGRGSAALRSLQVQCLFVLHVFILTADFTDFTDSIPSHPFHP